ALLFLARANLAADLTAGLKGRVEDPGEVNLKAGGVGGEGLGPKAAKPDTPAAKPEEPEPKPPVKVKEPAPRKEVQPAEDVDAEANRLGAQLVKAPAEQQKKLIGQFKEKKGVVYTQALAEAIHKLSGPARDSARDALAQRMMRMTAPTLRERLADEDPEIRRAVALACAMKEDKGHVPDLIGLLGDRDPMVARSAHVALKMLTGKDFGPAAV